MRTSIYTIIFFLVAQLTVSQLYALSFKAEIKWKKENLDLGKVEKSKAVKAEFSFKNPGMIPLVISSVKPSCGCTVAEFPKQPIPPGGEGKITVTYDAKSSGFFSKSIEVFSNTEDGVTKLYIKGEVVSAKTE